MIERTQGGFLISQIKQISGRIFDKLLVDSGIDAFNGAQGRILYVLWQEDNVPIIELSQKTGLAKTTLTGMLERMEKTNLIKRVLDKSDRRQIHITLTEDARKLSEEYCKVSRKMNDVFYAGISEEDIVYFEQVLRKILKNLKESESQL